MHKRIMGEIWEILERIIGIISSIIGSGLFCRHNYISPQKHLYTSQLHIHLLVLVLVIILVKALPVYRIDTKSIQSLKLAMQK